MVSDESANSSSEHDETFSYHHTNADDLPADESKACTSHTDSFSAGTEEY